MARVSNPVFVWHIVINFVIIVLVSVPGVILEVAVKSPSTPFQRGMFCNDENIRYPLKKNTVSTSLAIVLCLGIPFVGMGIVEWLLFRRYKALGELTRDVPMYYGTEFFCVKVHGYIVAVVNAYAPFLFACAVSLSVTNGLKFMVGRLRPHFLSVCWPNFTATQDPCGEKNRSYFYIEDIPCDENVDPAEHLDARLSFPSGHASGAACALIYFSLYLYFRMVWKTPYLLRPFLQTLAGAGAVFIAASRVSDYKHFWSDVTFGFLLGTVIGVLVAFFVSDLYFSETPSTETNGITTKEFNTSPSETEMSAIYMPNYQSTVANEQGRSSKREPSNV